MEVLQNTLQTLGNYLPSIIAAILVLVVGWLIAALVSRLVRRLVNETRSGAWMTAKISPDPEARERLGRWISRGVFWLIMLFVLVAFFSVLQLMTVSGSVQSVLDAFLGFIPRLVAAVALVLVAWIVASVLRAIVARSVASLDRRIAVGAGEEAEQAQRPPRAPLSKILADAAYWLTFLLFLPAVLAALAMGGVLGPVQQMVEKVVVFLPNLFVAVIIGVVGWFFARVLARIVRSLLMAVGADRLVAKAGMERSMGTFSVSRFISLLVYVLVLVPVAIAALDALQLQAITRPASDMLNRFMAAIPAIFGAVLLLAIGIVVGKLLASLSTQLLTAAQFDSVPERLGLASNTEYSWRTPSQIVGLVVLIAAILTASIMALNLLGFAALAGLVTDFMVLLGRVALGLVVFGIGVYLAELAARVVRSREYRNARNLAIVTKASIIVLAGAVALRQMGIGNEIITLAFGLAMGAIAVAAAIAFGIGGRELAARKLEKWDKEHFTSSNDRRAA